MSSESNIKVYLAILNRGWIRREIVANILPLMKKTKGIELLWEHPNKTWDHPISSNRNRIVQRFLATDCDYLLMIDDDVVPLHNPCQLVFADKDVIGMPAKVRAKIHSLNWVAYMKNPYGDGYAPVDFSRVDTDIDLLEVDAIGTGCILIKRKVLEAIKAPFHIKFDDNGLCMMGTDFAFCERAKEAGFEIFTTPKLICEHFKEVGLADIMSYDDSDFRDELPIPWDYTGFEIIQGDWRFLKRIIKDENIKTVCEFGSGLSSLLLSTIVDVESWEIDEGWIEKMKRYSDFNTNIKKWDGKDFPLGNHYDLVFVDGPAGEGVGGPGRSRSMEIASIVSDRVVVHDAGRPMESRWQNKWLKPKFKLISKSGHHQTRCQYWKRRDLCEQS